MRATSYLLSSLLAIAAAQVVDLTPENFDEIVGGPKPALVKFYAPWCGHCKSMAPDYETFGETFKGANVVVAKLNADEHKDLAGRFGVRGFPTLKWFPANSAEAEDYSGGRTADDLISFTNGKIGTNYRVSKPASAVLDLDPSNFDAIVGDSKKHKLVEFFAPWCGHCKSLAPTYEKLAAAFEGESNVVVAKVDADKHRSLGEKFGVTGFPTIKYFPAESGDLAELVQDYNGGRSVEDFTNFLNEKAGTQRTPVGGLLPTAGRIAELDELAVEFMTATDKQAVLESAKKAAAELTGKDKANADLYVKAMQKGVEKGTGYFAKEVARLDSMLNSGAVSKAKKTDFMLRKNVLSAFEA